MQWPRAPLRERLAQIIGEPRNATLRRNGVGRKRCRHITERGSGRNCPPFPPAQLAVRVVKPELQVAGAIGEVPRAGGDRASPQPDAPQNRQRERRCHERDYREPTRHKDVRLRGRGSRTYFCIRPRIQQTPAKWRAVSEAM